MPLVKAKMSAQLPPARMTGDPEVMPRMDFQRRGPEVGLWQAIPTDIPSVVRSLMLGKLDGGCVACVPALTDKITG
jgi:hypothetical protein